MNHFTRSQRSQRDDDDIISIETRILPGTTPPTSTKRIPEVQIPERKQNQSSATPPSSATRIIPSKKRPESESAHPDPEMDPTPSKRQCVDREVAPKIEPGQGSSNAPPANNTTVTTSVTSNGNTAGPEKNATAEPTTAETAKPSYAHNLGNEMVYFRFGAQILPSSIHKKVLCDKIPGFKEELKWMDPEKNELDFPIDMAKSIEMLIEWSYTAKLPELTSATSPADCYHRIKLYVLAARYEQVQLMNETMDFITGYLRKNLPRWDIEWTTYVYNNTNPGSPLRKLMAKWWSQKFLATEDEGRWTTQKFSEAASAHRDLLLDVLTHLRKQTDLKAGNPKKHPPTTYHVNVVSPEPIKPQIENRKLTPEDSDSETYDSEESSESDSEDEEDSSEEDIRPAPAKPRGGRNGRA